MEPNTEELGALAEDDQSLGAGTNSARLAMASWSPELTVRWVEAR